MKLRLFPQHHSTVGAAPGKPAPTASEPASRPAPVVTPAPRVWSLLLPPGFTSDRR
ncbi:MAG TPA: hypothetical protein VFH80_26180 [Solirubrobacteraceae bacterium]|nr:hypothetical protein [Solirubrobacteraceae bacterium]